MAVSTSTSSWLLSCLIVVLFFACPTRAFGAGNIGSTSEIEGQNWRHGDVEDTLLTLLISVRPAARSLANSTSNVSTLAIGFATTAKQLMSGLSNTSVPKLFEFCFGSSVSSLSDMGPRSLRSQRRA